MLTARLAVTPGRPASHPSEVFDPNDVTGYGTASAEHLPSDATPHALAAPAEPCGPRGLDRDTQRQAPKRHITGEAAMRIAKESNRAEGSRRPPLELESGHELPTPSDGR
jgi:hypothetical protein